METVRLGNIDYVILIVYTLFVLGIGFALKKFMRTSTDYYDAAAEWAIPRNIYWYPTATTPNSVN